MFLYTIVCPKNPWMMQHKDEDWDWSYFIKAYVFLINLLMERRLINNNQANSNIINQPQMQGVNSN